MESEIAKLCAETDISNDDYVAALEPEHYDPSDLVTAVFNSPFPIGTSEWYGYVGCQVIADAKIIRAAAEEIKNDRVAREYDPTGE